MSEPVTVTFEREWRSATWDADTPSRPAWFVACTDHPQLGKDWDGRPWGYAASGIAHSVATRHMRAKHWPGR